MRSENGLNGRPGHPRVRLTGRKPGRTFSQAGAPVLSVKPLREDAVQLPHPHGEVSIRGLDQQMVVIAHQAISVAEPMVAVVNALKDIQECFAVRLGTKDGLPFIASAGDMIKGTGIFYAKGTSHVEHLAHRMADVKNIDLTPFSPRFFLFSSMASRIHQKGSGVLLVDQGKRQDLTPLFTN